MFPIAFHQYISILCQKDIDSMLKIWLLNNYAGTALESNFSLEICELHPV
jgi:hypothetical protein